MDEQRLAERTAETLAMMLVGDGVITLMYPQRHVRLWSSGPGPWRDAMRAFEEHPTLTRVAAAAEIGIGLWLAGRQYQHRHRVA